MPPVALPAEDYMRQAKDLWESLHLPALRPQTPWFGYSLGVWEDAWQTAADNAAASAWQVNGESTWNRRRTMGVTNLPSSVVEGAPDESATTAPGRARAAAGCPPTVWPHPLAGRTR